jgi:tetratricopeptide (TPR) repeat protein
MNTPFYRLKELNENKMEFPLVICKERIIAEGYICIICLNLPLKPKICIQCEKIICSNCFEQYSTNYKNCPTCKAELNCKDLGRLGKHTINNLNINCINSQCKAQIKFENATKHLKSCEFTKREAVCLKCNKDIVTTNRLNGILDHVMSCSRVIPKNEELNNINAVSQNDVSMNYFLRGNALLNQAKYIEAIEHFEKALQFKPSSLVVSSIWVLHFISLTDLVRHLNILIWLLILIGKILNSMQIKD